MPSPELQTPDRRPTRGKRSPTANGSSCQLTSSCSEESSSAAGLSSASASSHSSASGSPSHQSQTASSSTTLSLHSDCGKSDKSNKSSGTTRTQSRQSAESSEFRIRSRPVKDSASEKKVRRKTRRNKPSTDETSYLHSLLTVVYAVVLLPKTALSGTCGVCKSRKRSKSRSERSSSKQSSAVLDRLDASTSGSSLAESAAVSDASDESPCSSLPSEAPSPHEEASSKSGDSESDNESGSDSDADSDSDSGSESDQSSDCPSTGLTPGNLDSEARKEREAKKLRRFGHCTWTLEDRALGRAFKLSGLSESYKMTHLSLLESIHVPQQISE